MKAKHLGNLTGAFADLGVLLPILAALTLISGVNLPMVLLTIGGIYIVSGFFFRLPVPVQPLKVACALAIAQKLPATVLTAAGFEMGLILLIFGGSGLADRLGRFFDKPLVRGMQLGVGLILMERGVALAFENSGSFHLKTFHAVWSWPAPTEWWIALVSLVIPQIPVTLSNAVVGSVDVAGRYYRWMAKKVTPKSLCLSMSAANIVMALTGGIPVCHGSSGWTAHRRLGARSHLSTCLLGVLLISSSFLLWNRGINFLAKVPGPFLGSLLVYVGLRHALLIQDVLEKKQAAFLAIGSGGISYFTKNPALGLGIGLCIQVCINFLIKFFTRRPKTSENKGLGIYAHFSE